MSLTRLAQSVLVLAMLAAGTGCVQPVGEEPDTSATAETSSALTTTGGGASPGKFIMDIATDLISGNIGKLVYGEGVDYARLDKMFEDDLQKYANKQHVGETQAHVTGTLQTLKMVLAIYEAKGTVSPNDVTLLTQRFDRLNTDLASMRQEDVKKVGLRSYLWAATVQHAVLQALAIVDKDHAAEHQIQLRMALQEHAEYVTGRVAEFTQDAATRVNDVGQCDYYQQIFVTSYAYFNDQGADYGSDPAVPNVEGADYGPAANYTSDRAWAWGLNRGTQYRWFRNGPYATVKPECDAARARYLTDMQAKLDVMDGFAGDENLPDTRVLLQKWEEALTTLGGPVAK